MSDERMGNPTTYVAWSELEPLTHPPGSETWEADRNMGQALSILADAARKYSRLVEPCTTCNGHGMVTHAKAKTTLERAILHDCPDCGGSGVVPSEQAIEVVGGAAHQAQVDYKGSGSMLTPNEFVGRAVIMALLKGTE